MNLEIVDLYFIILFTIMAIGLAVLVSIDGHLAKIAKYHKMYEQFKQDHYDDLNMVDDWEYADLTEKVVIKSENIYEKV